MESGLKKWLWPMVVLFLIALVAALVAFQTPPELDTDQEQIGVMILAQLKPENFTRDYAAGDPEFYGYYTPFYLNLVLFLIRITGSYTSSLALLVFPVGFTYMLGMTLVLERVSKRRWLSLGLAVVSTIYFLIPVKGDWWGTVLSFNGMAPRSVYLAVFPFLMLGLLKLLDEEKGTRLLLKWLLLGLGFGLAGNLHPVSAIAVGILSVGMVGVGILEKRTNLLNALVFVGGMALGALPTLISVLSGTEGVNPEYSFTFQTFYEYGAIRNLTFYPFSWLMGLKLPLFGLSGYVPRDELIQNIIIGLYTILTVVGVAGLLFGKKNSRKQKGFLYLLVITQLVMLVVFTILRMWVAVLVLAYGVYRLKNLEDADVFDKRILEMVVLVLLIFPITAIGQWVWKTYGVWSLTLWVTQLPRGLRFVFFPIFLVIIKLLKIWYQEKDWALLAGFAFMFIGSFTLLPEESPFPIFFYAEYVFMVLVPLVWLLYPHKAKRPALARWLLQFLAFSLIATEIFIALEFFLSVVSFLACIGLILIWQGVLYFKEKVSGIPTSARIINAGAVIALVFLSIYVGRSYPLGEDFAKTWNALVTFDRSAYVSEHDLDEIELYKWARTETSIESLFYTNNFSFRLWAERSITHSWKDLGNSFFVRYPYIEHYERFNRLELVDVYDLEIPSEDQAEEGTQALLEAIVWSEADYVIIDKSIYAERAFTNNYLKPLRWDIVFENEHFKVFAVPPVEEIIP